MNEAPAAKDGISRRKLLIGGGVGVGLLVAWGLWQSHRRHPAERVWPRRVFGAGADRGR